MERRIWGLMMVKNEGDVIEEILSYLREKNFYHKIFFFDNDSKDDTFKKARKFKDILYKPQKVSEAFTEGFKRGLLRRYENLYEEGDWLGVVDGDEFLQEDPQKYIKLSEKEKATRIMVKQMCFYYTDRDLMNNKYEDRNKPIRERRKYYMVNHVEPRFYKYIPGILRSKKKTCSKRILNKHYPFRTPEQIKMRIYTRAEAHKKTKAGSHWKDSNWRHYIVRASNLHKLEPNGNINYHLPKNFQFIDEKDERIFWFNPIQNFFWYPWWTKEEHELLKRKYCEYLEKKTK